jgi:hypothetical protein
LEIQDRFGVSAGASLGFERIYQAPTNITPPEINRTGNEIVVKKTR